MAAPSIVEVVAFPDEVAVGLARCAPQSMLVGPMVALEPSSLTGSGRIDAVIAVQRHIAMLQALSEELLAAIEDRDVPVDEFARDAVAAAMRIPPAAMRTHMSVASELTERLPSTLALLRAGAISRRHAVDLADATRCLTPQSASVVEERVLARAPEQTAAQFRASVKRAVLRVADAAAEDQAHRDAVSERRVVITPGEHGMAELWALLPADAAAGVKAALDAMAHTTIHGVGGDERTADQRRADALVQLAGTALAGRALSTAHGQHPAIGVTVAASTLLGLDDQPAELEGYGPISAAMARRVATDPSGRWRRLLTDDDGRVLSTGTRTYRPPPELARTVITRDVHCTFPGCRRSAHHNDIDHIRAYRAGGTTTPANLMSLCRRHHRLKHAGRWHVHRDDPTGVTTWTDPHGRTHHSRPPTRPTTTTAEQRAGNQLSGDQATGSITRSRPRLTTQPVRQTGAANPAVAGKDPAPDPDPEPDPPPF